MQKYKSKGKKFIVRGTWLVVRRWLLAGGSQEGTVYAGY
jgi:hypothetical protein